MKKTLMSVFGIFILMGILFLGCDCDDDATLEVTSVTATPATCDPGDTVAVVVTYDYDGDGTLSFTWTASGGTVIGSDADVNWVAPATAGTCNVAVTVFDDDLEDNGNVDIVVIGYSPGDTSLFKVTTGFYPETIDLDSIAISEFGPSYRLADWNDLVSYSGDIEALANSIGILSEPDSLNDCYVKKNGDRWYSLTRHYFIQRHDGTVPGGWLVHDTIDDHFIDLGSWYGMSKRVLCIRID